MKKKEKLKIGICFLVLSLCLPVAYAQADEGSSLSGEMAQSPGVRNIPVTGLNGAPPADVFPPAPLNGVVDNTQFIQGTPGLHSPNVVLPIIDQAIQGNPGAVLSAQQVGILVDGVVSGMINAGTGENLLANIQQNDPVVLNQLITSIDEASKQYSDDSASQAYLDNWRKEAEQVRNDLLLPQQGGRTPDPLVAKLTKLYQPIAKRISEITRELEAVVASPGGSGEKGAKLSSSDLLKGFSEKAKQFIVNSIGQAQTNLEDGVLSNPLGTTAFAAEAAPALISGDTLGPRKMTVAELYIKSQSQKYQVADSIYIGKDFIHVQRMLHPPANLHPYLKWLLYTRNLTPRMMENYLTTREAVLDIYGQAKAGHGNIRYRGKVYGAFLPFAETAAGNYELVKSVSSK